MYACVLANGRGFSEGRVHLAMHPPVSATHPYQYPSIRELTTPCRVVLAAANLYSLLQHLVPSDKPQGRE